MAKLFIKNRKNQKIAVIIQEPKSSKGLVFVMHGLGGTKDSPQSQTVASAFFESGYTTILFDTTNTFGESEGDFKKATTTNYYEDLEDVIRWAEGQNFYKEPFILAGHSLGGICVALYAQKYPKKIKALAPLSTVVSGKLSASLDSEKTAQWQKTGWHTETRSSGQIKTLPWSHMEDRMKYDLLPNAEKLTMPVLMVVGEFDDRTPPTHQKMLYNKLPGEKEIHIIKNAPHTFRGKEHLKQLKEILLNWIEKI